MADVPPKSQLEEAEELLDSGQFAAAANLFEGLVESHPEDSGPLVGWAKALIGCGMPDIAFEKLRSALAIDPAQREAYAALAPIVASLDKGDEALTIYEGGNEFFADVGFYVSWGCVLAEMEKYEQARWRLNDAISIDQRCVPAHLAMGQVLLKLGIPVEAASHFEYVGTELDKGNGAAFSGWGHACLASYEPDLAVQKFERAVELDGDGVAPIDHWLDISDTRYEQNHFTEALAASKAAQGLEDRGASLFQKYRARHRAAVAAIALDLPEDALAYCDEGIKVLTQAGGDPSAEASLHFVAGAARAMLKLYGDAVASYRLAAATSDVFAIHSINSIAVTFAVQGRYSESWQELAQLGEARKRVEDLFGGILDDEQQLAYGTGQLWFEDLAEAQTAFGGAVEAMPRNPNAWAKLMILCLARREKGVEEENEWKWRAYDAYCKAVSLLETQADGLDSAEPLSALGLLHLLMDDLDKAETRFKEALKLDERSPTPFAALGLVSARKGKYERAINHLNSALVRDPDNLIVKCHLADAYLQLGRHAAALDTYEDVLRVAPNNVGARIGAGESLIEQAEDLGDDLLYEDAAVHLNEAVALAGSIRPGSPDRKGSTGLGMRQWADLYYARGYVRVKLYESEMGTRIGLPSWSTRKHLSDARKDFEAAAKTKVNPHRAERAATSIRKRLKMLSPGMLTEIYAPLAVVAVAFVLLVIVQIAFFTNASFSEGKNTVAYTTLTLALLLVIVAGFYLPQVLKLKLGGIQLEKATSQVGESGALNVPRHPFQANLHAIFEPTVPRSRMLERDQPTHAQKRANDAREGAVQKDSPVGVGEH